MEHKIVDVRAVSVGTTAQDIDIGFREFLLHNNSETATVFIRPKMDGVAVTKDNGFPVEAGDRTELPMSAGVLSIVASATADVRILLLDSL